VTRRSFLKSASAAAVAVSPVSRLLGAQQPQPYGPFRMGIQSYSLRGKKLPEALAATKELGLAWWEAYDGHIPVADNPADRGEIRVLLAQNGIKLRTFGVMGFTADEARSRRIFEFARLMGIETLSADPAPEAFPSLVHLTAEFGVNIAIHNHGPGSRYDKIDSVWNAIKDRPARIGACVDTGHFLRSKEDPVRAIELFGDRVHGVHLKDVKDATQFKILGQGDLDVSGTLRALKKIGFDGILSLEYEENPQNPLPDIKACLEVVRRTLEKI
jgi:sugar phosphate isomerase/epimerase